MCWLSVVSSAAIHSVNVREAGQEEPVTSASESQVPTDSSGEVRAIPYIVQPGQGGVLPPIPMPPGVLPQQPPYTGGTNCLF